MLWLMPFQQGTDRNREFEVRSRCHGYDIYTARSEGIMRDLGLLNLRVDQEEYNRSLLCLL